MVGLMKRALSNRLLGVTLAAVVVAGSYLGYTQVFASKAPETPMQTVAVERGNLRLAVTASGSVTSPRAVDLSFRQSGVVDEVYVQVGDAVKAGDPLAKLETRSIEFQVRQAEIGLRTAQLSLDSLLSGARREDIESAEAGLTSARAKLQTMEAQGEPRDVAAAEAGLQSAQAKRDLLLNPTAADITNARAAVETAAAGLQSARVKLEQLRNPSASDVTALENSLSAAQAKLLALRNPTAADIASAQSSIASAEAGLATARNKLDLLKNPSRDKVIEAEASVRSSENALLVAQNKLADMKLDFNDEKLRNLIKAYTELYFARQKLDEDRARNAPAEQIALDEQAVLRALHGLQTAEADADTFEAGHSVVEIQSATAAVAKAQTDLESARIKLQQLVNPLASDIAEAENGVVSAEASLSGAKAKLEQLRNPSQADLIAAQSAVSKAQADLDKLQNPQPSDLSSAEAAVTSAQASLTNAEAKLTLLLNPNDADIAAATSSIVQAENQLAQAKIPYKDADIASQRSSVQQAMASLSKTTMPSTAQDIAKTQLTVDRAQLDLDQAVYNLDHAVLRAPFDAIVSKVAAFPGGQPTSVTTGTAGTTSGGGASITIVDPNGMQVQVSVDESDVSRIELGQAAEIAVEAAGLRPYRGRVVAISPSGTVQSGVTTYQVLLAIDTTRAAADGDPRAEGARAGGQRGQGAGSGGGQQGGRAGAPRGSGGGAGEGVLPSGQLRAGMTAVTTIVYAERQDILLIPNRAIKRSGQNRTVEVQAGDQSETRTVRVGLSDDQRTEVLEGLQEGDTLVMEAARTAPAGGAQRPLGGGGLGGGFGVAIRR